MNEPAQEGIDQPVRELTPDQRRVLGVLVEKGLTTPEYYPLTLKALATGCSQKSNRDPVRNYSEDDVEDAVRELQALGLVTEVHTDGGRAARYRHLVRKRFEWTEPQIAIITELWLRGRQQLGELRSRASRMVPIESLEELREALQGLLAESAIRASGPLDRRGVEVDHNFYPASERVADWSAVPGTDAPSPAPAGSAPSGDSASLLQRVSELERQVIELTERLDRLERAGNSGD